jgi:hypothetical protein
MIDKDKDNDGDDDSDVVGSMLKLPAWVLFLLQKLGSCRLMQRQYWTCLRNKLHGGLHAHLILQNTEATQRWQLAVNDYLSK